MTLNVARISRYFDLRYKHDLTWRDSSFWSAPHVVEEDLEYDDVQAPRLTDKGMVALMAEGNSCGKGCCGPVYVAYEFPLADLDRPDEDLIAEFEVTSKAYVSAQDAAAAERQRAADEQKEKAERAELARLLAKYGLPDGATNV